MKKVRLVPKGTAKSPVKGKLVPKTEKPRGRSPFRRSVRNVA